MSMNIKQKKELKSRAHHLKPVVRIGQHGVSEGVVGETNLALDTHALIKVHIQHDEREVRLQHAESLISQTHAELVHKIGKIFVLYRQKSDDTAK